MNALEMGFLEAQIEATLQRHKDIVLARAYHEGIQPIYLTERQREFLDLHSDNQFCLNMVRLVTTSLSDELNVVGFETSEDGEGIKKQAQWFWDVWKFNQMDIQQSDVHEKTISEGESFIVLGWDKESSMPTAIFHEVYTDANTEAWEGKWSGLTPETMAAMRGTGQGVWMIYENSDPYQRKIAAVQQWVELTSDENNNLIPVKRRTIYYPDHIERYYHNGTDWVKKQEDQQWKDKKGKPIGIPVVHFKNRNLRPEAWDAIPANDVINKTWVDILGSADLSGYPLFMLLGLYPTTDGKAPAADGSNVWSVGPAEMLGNASVKAGEATVQKFEGSDPTPLMNTLKDQIMFLAQITDTPVSHFITTAQVASADTLKEQERRLRKRVLNRMILIGDAWEEVMVIARKINNAFGSEELDEGVKIETIWRNIQTLDDLRVERELGVPEETIWMLMGKTQEQIDLMKNTPEYRVKMEKALWDGFMSASAQGIPLDVYLRRVGLSEEEIKELSAIKMAENEEVL